MNLVAVIVPAHNAQFTLDATLASVRSQTHRELEIIVINDGSTDETEAIVLRHIAADTRVRLVAQANGGVAAARNRGIAESTAPYIAPIDADDLWRPEKIERQIAAIRKHPHVALVSTAYSVLDERGCVTLERGINLPRTNQFLDLCRRNFIGNGSSALIRRSAIEECGGYDETLRKRRAQGCEDLKLYLSISERHAIEMIQEPLTGYRELSDNMSSDVAQMLRSFDLVAAEFCERRPDLRARFDAHRTFMVCWLMHRMARSKRWRTVVGLGTQLFSVPSLAFPQAIALACARRLVRLPPILKRARVKPRRAFLDAAL